MDHVRPFAEVFADRLDLHGADLDRWPAEEAAAARALLARDPEARAMHATARRLDGHLATISAVAPLPADRLGRLMDGLARRRHAAREPLFALLRPRAAFAMTAVACVMFGLGAWTGGEISAASDAVAFASLDPDQIWAATDR